VTIGDWIRVSGDRVVGFGAAIALIAALLWVIRSTDTGRAWRALAQSRLGAQVVGVDVRALSNRAFAASGALAGASAALVAPILSVYPAGGDSALIKSFIAVIIGGLGSVPGSLIGGLLLGLVEALGAVYVSSAYTDAYGFLIMAFVLLLWPTGLFGRKVRLV
jgi:branched-chain amino acid transport system permease protein